MHRNHAARGKRHHQTLALLAQLIPLAVPALGHAATLTTIATFNGANGLAPFAGLTIDSAGNLFGTTNWGGAANKGTVFEVAKGSGGYSLSTIATFDGTNGSYSRAVLFADSAGNLFGTTNSGGAHDYGTVFELVKGSGGYTLSTLATFDGTNGISPNSALIADSAGNLFGTTNSFGPGGAGTVFELVKSSGGYSISTLAAFSSNSGGNPVAGVIADNAGNLFGTTAGIGATDAGTVFELVKGSSGYTLTTLATFNGTNGAAPYGSLMADSAGNLFGTTYNGGANDKGIVFELAKGSGGYVLSTLATFNGTNGANPAANLIADSAGNLFGTTWAGGANNLGTVFELIKGSGGYTLSTLAAFNGTYGANAFGSLVADSAGNIFGTTVNGVASGVYQITGSGFVTAGATQAVPEPAGLCLFGLSLVLLAGLHRSRAAKRLVDAERLDD